jgi:hypothetical protein
MKRCSPLQVVLLLLMFVTGSMAAFTETFSTVNDNGFPAELPGVWQQISALVDGGRGATSDDNRRCVFPECTAL